MLQGWRGWAGRVRWTCGRWDPSSCLGPSGGGGCVMDVKSYDRGKLSRNFGETSAKLAENWWVSQAQSNDINAISRRYIAAA